MLKTYRVGWSFGNGILTFDAFLASAYHNYIFVKELKLYGAQSLMKKTSLSNSILNNNYANENRKM